jgi:hypothetical protein
MLNRIRIAAAAIALTGALTMTAGGCWAADDPRYPDWEGAWIRIPVRLPTQPSHDQTKPWGRGQEAPLTPEYQAILERFPIRLARIRRLRSSWRIRAA